MNILAVDVGTSSMRGILFSKGGEKLCEKQCCYQVNYMNNGWVEQDPIEWKNALYLILTTISNCAKSEKWKIDAITITSQRSSVIPVDREIKPIMNAIMWQDKRTNDICKRLEKQNDRVFSLCGARVNPVFSASKMTWIRENRPEVYSKTYKFMVVPDYLIYLLTGNICTDYTYGSRSLLMNIYNNKWDDELLDLFKVEKNKLCDLIAPGSICGYTTEEISAITEISEGIPVITAGGDQQCGAIGQGVIKEGVLSITAGTGGFLITAVNNVPENLKQNVICNASSINGQYVLEFSVLTCCSALDWFVREFYGNISYEELSEEIKKSLPDENSCICAPYFQGRSTPDWNNNAKGAFVGITLNTKKRDLLRSLLEGICFEINNGIKIMKDYVELNDIYINGGLTNNDVFNEMQSDIYEMRLIRRGKTDATARGAWMIAAVALKLYDSFEDAFLEIGKNDIVCSYNPKQNTIYKEKNEYMNQIYDKIYL